jgi:signal transduction histidine kinase
MRWLAAAAALVGIEICQYLICEQFPYRWLYGVVGCIFLYNCVLYVVITKIHRSKIEVSSINQWLVRIQINLDFLALFFLFHFSGGVENPFIILFLLHAVFCCVLCTPSRAVIQIFVASALLFLLGISEKLGVLTHYHPSCILPDVELANNWLFALGIPAMISLIMATFAVVIIPAVQERMLRQSQVMALSAELTFKNDELERLAESRRGLLTVASHDLKAPISAAQSYLMALRDGYMGDITENQREVVEKILERLRSLHVFIADILSLQAIDAGEMKDEMKPVDMVALIEEVVESYRDQFDSKEIEPQMKIGPGPLLVEAIPERLIQMMNNLVSNAIKYTPKKGRIVIEATESDRLLTFAVKDNGIGIEASDIPKLFDEFFRAGAVKTTYEGTGVGLAIVRRIIEFHGGRVWVESELGVGSNFFFELPRT